MRIFEKRKTHPPNSGGDGDTGLDQLSELRGEVPDIEDTLDRLERGLTEPMEERTGGCGCWG